MFFYFATPDTAASCSFFFHFSGGSFDKVYCLSVFHHIPSRDFRLRFLAEIKRVLKPDGVLILTVWNFWGFRGILEILKYAILKIFGRRGIDPVRSSATSSMPQMQKGEVPLETRFLTGRSRPTSQSLLSAKHHKTSNGVDFKDIFVPFKDSSGKILAERYFHCFTKRELKRLFSVAGFKTAEFRVLKRGRYENFCLIGKQNGYSRVFFKKIDKIYFYGGLFARIGEYRTEKGKAPRLTSSSFCFTYAFNERFFKKGGFEWISKKS